MLLRRLRQNGGTLTGRSLYGVDVSCSGEELLPSGGKDLFVRRGVLGSGDRTTSYHSETVSLPLAKLPGMSGWSNVLPSNGHFLQFGSYLDFNHVKHVRRLRTRPFQTKSQAGAKRGAKVQF